MSLFRRTKKTSEEGDSERKVPEVLKKDEIISLFNGTLEKVKDDQVQKYTVKVPIGELTAMGGIIGELIPAFRSITNNVSVNTPGLYRWTNQAAGDTLKAAKNGNFWGAAKSLAGKSKMVQLQEVGSVDFASKVIMPINPATMMVAVALASIEKQIGDILEMEKKILSFLEQEKEAEIENDLDILINIIQEYKLNWDDEVYISTKRVQVDNIQRDAGKHMRSYQKKIHDITSSSQLVVANVATDATSKELMKNFQYYRMSLYNFAFSSFLKVVLSGNYREENIQHVKGTVKKYSDEYNQVYEEAFAYLGKMVDGSVETNIVKGIGIAGKAIGGFIGNIPLIKEGPVDEWLLHAGNSLEQTGKDVKSKKTVGIESVKNPGSDLFIQKLETLNQICNHTSSICFDNEAIYLVQN